MCFDDFKWNYHLTSCCSLYDLQRAFIYQVICTIFTIRHHFLTLFNLYTNEYGRKNFHVSPKFTLYGTTSTICKTPGKHQNLFYIKYEKKNWGIWSQFFPSFSVIIGKNMYTDNLIKSQGLVVTRIHVAWSCFLDHLTNHAWKSPNKIPLAIFFTK